MLISVEIAASLNLLYGNIFGSFVLSHGQDIRK